MDGNSQPTKLLTQCTILSSEDTNNHDSSLGIKWNGGRRIRLLVIHFIGPIGLIKEFEQIWIQFKSKTLSSDYLDDDDDAEALFNWFTNPLYSLPLNSFGVCDNTAIHNKRPACTPNSQTKKSYMQ